MMEFREAKGEEVKILLVAATKLKWRMCHGFLPECASDLEVTAQLRTWYILYEERPLRRLQRLISPNQDGSHPMHRVTKE